MLPFPPMKVVPDANSAPPFRVRPCPPAIGCTLATTSGPRTVQSCSDTVELTQCKPSPATDPVEPVIEHRVKTTDAQVSIATPWPWNPLNVGPRLTSMMMQSSNQTAPASFTSVGGGVNVPGTNNAVILRPRTTTSWVAAT